MKSIQCSIAAIAVLALAIPAVGDEPVGSRSQNDDSAFDRFVSGPALAEAWTKLDAAGMADGALQTLEAERVLGRSKPHLSAQVLFTLTMRLALEQNNVETLDRLNKAATQANRPELVEALLIAQKTAGPSRAGKNIAPVTPQDTDVPTFRAYRAFLHDIQAARLCGDARALDSIASDLEGVSQFTEPQRESLLAQIKDAGGEADVATDLPDALNRLVSGSRGIKFQGIHTHYETPRYDSDFDIVETNPQPRPSRPTVTGPQLGQQRAGQATNGHMSYEARQAGLELLRNPKGIKPSLAGSQPSRRRP
jgi:hypothetical protein